MHAIDKCYWQVSKGFDFRPWALISIMQLFVFFAGKNPTDEYLVAMMNEAPGPINFTMFLTMFGEKLNGTDPEDVIRNAFACFDEGGTGTFAWAVSVHGVLLVSPHWFWLFTLL